ncbi:gamma-glutamylcyclotransferase family protein [Gaoshiqia sediminis]|uniref:Putative gamma-glutamylcyclotransferase n=1 Tax=Gaoshiqia sediminis TaxID=2986998 RepID=A0AA41Y9N6_9BACT|nr:gamma-glutamylcyclotransferase family protein [Gaoshiqia sediminis]MCW0484734.1 gamma-glutamylcyclotransferase [Gaoshiqia sediminis]
MDKLWLFSYGTLSDPEYIHLLLKRLPVYTEAVLPGYELLIHPANGYLFVAPSFGNEVAGMLFEITAKELLLLDLWEEVPLYEREEASVRTIAGEVRNAFVYVQKQTTGMPFSPQLAKSRRLILQEIEDFLESVRRRGFGH